MIWISFLERITKACYFYGVCIFLRNSGSGFLPGNMFDNILYRRVWPKIPLYNIAYTVFAYRCIFCHRKVEQFSLNQFLRDFKSLLVPNGTKTVILIPTNYIISTSFSLDALNAISSLEGKNAPTAETHCIFWRIRTRPSCITNGPRTEKKLFPVLSI